MFCGIDLAKRIERAECSMLVECATAVANGGDGREAFVLEIAGGMAIFAGADSPITKVAGVGFEGAPALEELERIEAQFSARKAPVQVELSNLAATGIAEQFTARGYGLVGFENVLGRQLDPGGQRLIAPEGIDVTATSEEEFETWLDVVVSGFAAYDQQGVVTHDAFPRDAIERVMRDMASAKGFVRYLARRGVTAGGATMHIVDRLAQSCGAATLPDHRRRGVQRALLERRLADAARQGCDHALITTLPGSKSQQNAQKQGFDLLYTRAVLRRPVA